MTLGKNMQTEGNYSRKYYLLFILFQQTCFPKSTTLLEFTLPWVNSQQILLLFYHCPRIEMILEAFEIRRK